MRIKQLLPLVTLTLVPIVACQEKDPLALAEIAALKARIDTLQNWLGKSPNAVSETEYNVHAWHNKVYAAICNLEAKASPPNPDRLCKAGDPDHNSPPNPPPWL